MLESESDVKKHYFFKITSELRFILSALSVWFRSVVFTVQRWEDLL